MLIDVSIIVAGIILVVLLADLVIRNSIDIAHHLNLSGAFVGLTILSIGTSIPEIMTHIMGSIAIVQNPARLDALSGLLIGTNIGSDVFQQNFVLPLVGIVGTIVVVRQELAVEVGALIGATLLLLVLCLGGTITRLDGVLLTAAYLGYLALLAKRNHVGTAVQNQRRDGRRHLLLAAFIVLMGFIVMAVVTDRIVESAATLVERLPISASFFGVLVLGVATALPELTTALVSIAKGENDISAGVLIGSNVTNPLLGIGLGAIISTYTVPGVVVFYDLPIKLITAILLYVFLRRRADLDRREAALLIGIFLVYLLGRNRWFPTDVGF